MKEALCGFFFHRRRLRESKTISEELSRLASQQDKISREKLSLEKILRDESISKQSMEHHMHKWVQLINQENSLVTRQMQLNIEEQVLTLPFLNTRVYKCSSI